ncbi:DUF4435 domain-containing protein [Paenibacillus sp. CF095]|uniref:DUF4435 domain-containing protein n=1 Tax=Paenibacillus sp. CF095 TaxID=1881033 RepID=UPI00210C8D95|nr:DUF4435 domain-containing protein [Paenibacillus sp. CF095]
MMNSRESDYYLSIQEKNQATRLEGNKVPSLIIEGKTDLKMYRFLLKQSLLDWNDIDIVVGTSKSNILAHHDSGTLRFNYVILLDSDYERYQKKLREDKAIIYTHFYNIENYLTTDRVLEATIQDFTTTQCSTITSDDILNDLLENLTIYMTACLAKLKEGWTIKLEDCSLERWWDQSSHKFDSEQFITYLVNELAEKGNDVTIENLKILIDTFSPEIKKSSLDLILNGKRKVEFIYFYFSRYRTLMEGRNKRLFMIDLLKNVDKSPQAVHLVKMLDQAFLRLI